MPHDRQLVIGVPRRVTPLRPFWEQVLPVFPRERWVYRVTMEDQSIVYDAQGAADKPLALARLRRFLRLNEVVVTDVKVIDVEICRLSSDAVTFIALDVGSAGDLVERAHTSMPMDRYRHFRRVGGGLCALLLTLLLLWLLFC